MVEFKLPDIGEGLSEAELLEWTVRVGDRIREGDEVAMISTDKVNVDLTSPATGVVIELFGEAGDVIKVGTLIMRIDDGSGTETAQTGTTVKAAPVVRRYAAEQGVDIAAVDGTGPGGQVVRGDIDAFVGVLAEGPAAQDSGIRRMMLTGPRLAAAQHLALADRTQVMTTINFEIQADALLERLQQLSRKADESSALLTPTALIVQCLVATLAKHPRFNAIIDEEQRALLMHDTINIGLAVDTGDGLMVPVIRGLQNMSVFELAVEIDRLAKLARNGELELDDVKGSTFTLSSTGSLERVTITATTPIINYPNVATLWVSRISDRPRVVDGALGAGPMAACSLSFDHRYLHGADGIAFINDLEAAFQSPA